MPFVFHMCWTDNRGMCVFLYVFVCVCVCECFIFAKNSVFSTLTSFSPRQFYLQYSHAENKVVYFKDIGLWYLPDEKDKMGICSSGLSLSCVYNAYVWVRVFLCFAFFSTLLAWKAGLFRLYYSPDTHTHTHTHTKGSKMLVYASTHKGKDTVTNLCCQRNKYWKLKESLSSNKTR